MSENPPSAPDGHRAGADEEIDYALLSLNAQLCFALYSTSRSMTAAYRPFLEEMNLTYPQYLVLLTLWERPGITMKELGEHVHLDYGTLSPLVQRLTANGLVECAQCDRRAGGGAARDRRQRSIAARGAAHDPRGPRIGRAAARRYRGAAGPGQCLGYPPRSHGGGRPHPLTGMVSGTLCGCARCSLAHCDPRRSAPAL